MSEHPAETPQVVLGIDQATSTGFSVINAKTGDVLEYGTVVHPGKLGARMASMEEWLDKLLARTVPVLLVYERPHFRGYNPTVSCVGLVAVILKVCEFRAVPVANVPTMTLKKFATGNGGKATGKEQMIEAANKLTGVVRKLSIENAGDDDAADAIHVGRWGVFEWMTGNATKPAQKKTVKKRSRSATPKQ